MLSGTSGRLLRLSLQAAANGLVRNRLATVAATVTMTLMLLVLASVLVIRAGLDAALAYADSKVEVVAYLKLDATAATAERLSAEIRTIDGVREIRFLSAAQALKEFRQRLADRGEPDLTGDAGGNPLPASLEIALNDPLDTARVADGLRTIPSSADIERVIDGRVLAENLASITSTLRLISLVVLLGFAVAVLAVVVNAIRLAIFSRKDEIEIMRLVGASATWVRLPFILEGVAIGTIGALITLAIFGILGASVSAVMLNVFRVLPLETSGILVGQVAITVLGAGVGLGALGALLSLRGRLD